MFYSHHCLNKVTDMRHLLTFDCNTLSIKFCGLSEKKKHLLLDRIRLDCCHRLKMCKIPQGFAVV